MDRKRGVPPTSEREQDGEAAGGKHAARDETTVIVTAADLRELRALVLAMLKRIDKMEASGEPLQVVDREPSPEAYARVAAVRRRREARRAKKRKRAAPA